MYRPPVTSADRAIAEDTAQELTDPATAQEPSLTIRSASRTGTAAASRVLATGSQTPVHEPSPAVDLQLKAGQAPVPFVLPYVPRVSVVIPTLNEEKNLPRVLSAIPSWVYEVLLVDGNSTDRTVEVARGLLPDIRVVYQPGKGKGDALRAGFAAAEGEIIVMLDADGSTRPEEIPAFVGALLAGADYAKGSRFMQGGGSADMTLFRKVGHGALVQLVRTAFSCNFSDLCYGYNAFWAHVLPHLNLDADGFEIETLMNVRAIQAGLKVVEVHSFEERRIFGEGRLRAIPDGWRVLKTIIRERLGGSRPAGLEPRRNLRPVPLPVRVTRLQSRAARKPAVGE